MNGRSVSIKAKRANPLFEEWITEWKNSETSEIQQVFYDTALKSLQKFPLPLQTGRQCLILQGFDAKLCKKLDQKLEQIKLGKDALNIPQIQVPNESQEIIVRQEARKPNIKAKVTDANDEKTSSYVPAYQSGGYALLCGLYAFHKSNIKDVIKRDLVTKAQPFCDKPLMEKEAGSLYTQWSRMTTLISKKLVSKEGNPARFSLTSQGIEVAQKLYEDAMNNPEILLLVQKQEKEDIAACFKIQATDTNVKTKATKRKIEKNPSSSSLASSQSEACETYFFAPGSFKILLLVDTQETSGQTKKDYYDEIILELNNLCVDYEVRHLKVGDYAWICRDRETQRELTLPYIVERKRMDDFGASIKDGRFHEQKFRLKSSGIQNLIYLVESHGSNTHCGLPLANIYQAATNTLIQDGFSVKFTENIKRTAEYLAMFSKSLIRIFKDKRLMNCAKDDLAKISLEDDLIPLMTFKEFNLSSSKNKAIKVSDMFIKQLLQLSGISVDKALAIVGKYPTPRALKLAYSSCTSEKEAETLLAHLEFGSLRKKIGPVISTTIYQFYNRILY